MLDFDNPIDLAYLNLALPKALIASAGLLSFSTKARHPLARAFDCLEQWKTLNCENRKEKNLESD